MGVIYTPSGRAREYSHFAVNHYVGCSHGCKYCYAARMAASYGNPDFFTKVGPKENIIDRISREALHFKSLDKRVLLCFSGDPYCPGEEQLGLTRRIIEILGGYRIPFSVLTKGGMRAARDFELYSCRDAFGATLTFLSDEKSKKWEPFAALPAERIASLREAKSRGIFTWASLEPVIDPDESLKIIEETHPYVDHYMVGKVNYVKNTIGWRHFASRAVYLLKKLNKSYYIKADLAAYLQGISYQNTDIRTVK